MTQRNARQKCVQAVGDPQQHSNQQTDWLQNFHAGKTKKQLLPPPTTLFKTFTGERIKDRHLKLLHLISEIIFFRTHFLKPLWMTIIRMDDVIWKTHLHGLSPPTGDVAVLQLLRPPSSLSFTFLRSGAGMYPLWLLLFGRYWLKGRGVRSSVTEVRRTDMSSLRTSGIFLWGGPSDSESLPRPGGDGKNTAIIRLSKDLYCVGRRKMQTHFNNMLAHSTNFQQKVSQVY